MTKARVNNLIANNRTLTRALKELQDIFIKNTYVLSICDEDNAGNTLELNDIVFMQISAEMDKDVFNKILFCLGITRADILAYHDMKER